jgi:hypothetical protein
MSGCVDWRLTLSNIPQPLKGTRSRSHSIDHDLCFDYLRRAIVGLHQSTGNLTAGCDAEADGAHTVANAHSPAVEEQSQRYIVYNRSPCAKYPKPKVAFGRALAGFVHIGLIGHAGLATTGIPQGGTESWQQALKLHLSPAEQIVKLVGLR